MNSGQMSGRSPPLTTVRRVGLFIDWNSQLRDVPNAYGSDPVERCRHAMNRVGKLATKALCAIDDRTRFRVRTRLYHGWTTGITQTINRRAFMQVREMLTPDDIFSSSRVLALSDPEFGDLLIDALPKRVLCGLNIHLPNTLRQQGQGQPATEKMVDTALATDLLSWARSEPGSIALVFSNDDDMIPPIFTAEAWMNESGGSVFLSRSPLRSDSKFLLLEGLLCRVDRQRP